MGRNLGADHVQQPERRMLAGLAIRDVYASRPCSDAEAGGVPGQVPFTRGSRRTRDPLCPWWIVSALPEGTPAEVNAAALEALEGGASGLLLPTCASHWLKQEHDRALRGIELAGVAVHLPSNDAALAAELTERAKAAGASGAGWCLGVDPLQHAPEGVAATLESKYESIASVRVLRADAVPFHEAGADAVLELALLLAASAHALRSGELQEHDPASVLAGLAWRLPMERDFFGGVVKLRAARLLWSTLARSCALSDPPAPFLSACGSRRTLTRRDPHNNLIRATVQAAAAAVGGADAITLPAFDSADGEGSALGRRMARNIPLVVEHEGRLLDVQDPAGGSEHVEVRTRELAAAAWEEFRGIEQGGGMVTALADGSLRARIDAAWELRSARLRSGEDALVGVNLHAVPLPEDRNEGSASTDHAWGLPLRREEDACAEQGGGA